MQNEKSKNKKTAKWYGSPLNSRIRDLIEEKNIKHDDFAKSLEISTEAVRLWCTGYARPDIDKLKTIADYFQVSCDYLLGKTDIKSNDTNKQAIGDYIGISDDVILTLKTYKNNKHENNIMQNNLDIFNKLVSSTEFSALLISINNYIIMKENIEIAYTEAQNKLLELHNKFLNTDDEYVMEKEIEIYKNSFDKKDRADLELWKIQKKFTELVEKLYG